MKNIEEIDTNVKDVIEANPEFHSTISFIDVFHASLFHPHEDFVHMDTSWCKALGNWLLTIM